MPGHSQTPLSPQPTVLRLPLATLLALLLAAASQASLPFKFETAPGRLPKDVVPLHYRVQLTPDIASMTINGHESVQLQFRVATTRVQFNSLGQTLTNVQLDGRPVLQVVSDDKAQLTTLSLPESVAAGSHTLSFSFAGKINESPIGLFRQRYVDAAGQRHELLSTQLESIYARQMIPCWDEPAFRASFALTVTADNALTAVSNMPVARRVVNGHRATTQFATTPSMPSYLLHLTVGDIAALRTRTGGVDIGIWAPRGQEVNGQVALDNARQILEDYNQYFGVPYPLPKLDSLAIPGGFLGAMENWGAITYTERLLLLTARSSISERQNVYSIQAHEMAHQWFGNLVTMGWWDDIWLNESFASWMAAKQTDRRNPDWHWQLGEDAGKESAMSADAIDGVHAIEQHISDEQLIDNAFDPQITYNKGQAILRMIEAYLGPDSFRDGIRRYLKDRAYSNATTADLWHALGATSRKDTALLAASWTEKPGFPLVTATSHCAVDGTRSVDLKQERFFSDGVVGNDSDWQIPLMVRSGSVATRTELLSKSIGHIAAGRCDEPLSLNADAIGYYRVSYDAETLAQNTRAFVDLPPGDGLVLLDDQWALASAARAPLAGYLNLVRQMKPEHSVRAWSQIAGAFDVLEFAERGSSGHRAFVDFARATLRPVFDHLGWRARPGETSDVVQLRAHLYADLGQWGDEQVVADARRRFGEFLANRAAVAPDEQESMLAVVAFNADQPSFDQLLKLAHSARDFTEVTRFYSALSNVHDDALAAKVVELALSGSLPPQANALPARMIRDLSGLHQRLAWQAFTANHEKLLTPDPSIASLVIAQYTPQRYWAGVPIDEIETWVRAHVPASMSNEVDRGLRSARARIMRKATLTREADAFLAGR